MKSGEEKDQAKNRVGDGVCGRERVHFQVGCPWRRGVSVTSAGDGLMTGGRAVQAGEEQVQRPGEAGGFGVWEEEQGSQCVQRCDGPSRPRRLWPPLSESGACGREAFEQRDRI